MTQAPQASPSRIHWPTFWGLFIVTGIAALIYRSENGYEIFTGSLKAAFSVISTPFLLEGFSMIAFGFIVVLANRWFQHRQKSDWVILPFTEEDASTEDQATLSSKVEAIQRALLEHHYEEALRLVKALGELPNSSTALLTIAEAMAKNFKLDEAMDVLAIHRRQFTSATEEAHRTHLTQMISQWLKEQSSEMAKDQLPRWYQLQQLYSDPSKA